MEEELQVPIILFAEFEVLFAIGCDFNWLSVIEVINAFKRSLGWIPPEDFRLKNRILFSKIFYISICYDFGTRIAFKFFACLLKSLW
jgi:hypothetical protein